MKTNFVLTACIICTFISTIFNTMDYLLLDSPCLNNAIASFILMLLSIIAWIINIKYQANKAVRQYRERNYNGM